jgi:hypothetical protein
MKIVMVSPPGKILKEEKFCRVLVMPSRDAHFGLNAMMSMVDQACEF